MIAVGKNLADRLHLRPAHFALCSLGSRVANFGFQFKRQAYGEKRAAMLGCGAEDFRLTVRADVKG